MTGRLEARRGYIQSCIAPKPNRFKTQRMTSAEGRIELPSNDAVYVNDGRDSDDDDVPTLSSHAMAALKEFLAQQNGELADEATADVEKVDLVVEDWRLSQFWYDRHTAETIAAEVVTLCGTIDCPRVACVACPTLYAYLKKIAPELPTQILEYDKRFEQYGSEFTFYDYNEPKDLPSTLKHSFPIIIADPPYLSKECLEKVTETIRYLSRPGEVFMLLLTGEVQKDLAVELLGLRPCCFRPQHSNKLGNEFRVFTSYDPGARLDSWER